MPEDNYHFVDGSCLIADIISMKSAPPFAGKRLSVVQFVNAVLANSAQILGPEGFHYRRFVFYFVNGENRIKDNIILPSKEQPGETLDVQVKYCGRRMEGSPKVDEWVAKVRPPQYVMDRLHKSEKAVDTQICCDTLRLACSRKLDRLFLYTNDSDFVPLAETLQSLGCNASLFRLTADRVNLALCEAFDTFSVLTQKQLEQTFVLTPDEDT